MRKSGNDGETVGRIGSALRLVPSLAVLVLLVALVVPALGSKDETTLISRQSAADGGAGADGFSVLISVSADGRYVAFESIADNLSTADNNGVQNIFLRDTATNTTTLITRQSVVDGSAAADDNSLDPSVSADGRYVAFTSDANNLSGADDNASSNVFLRDTQTNTTTLVSRQSAGDGGAGADGISQTPAISADGNRVAFTSDANNLSTADNDAFGNVFVRDIGANTTTLVSRQSVVDGGAGGDSGSGFPSISANGRLVAFESTADNLSTADDDTVGDVMLRDTQDNTTTLVSRQSAADGGLGGDAISFGAAISADGTRVAFQSDATNLSISDDSFSDVFVRDIASNSTFLASRQTPAEGGVGGDGGSEHPSISGDGRYVAFDSLADNLSTVDNNAVRDVFSRDTQTNVTTLVSRQSAAAGGAGGDALSQATTGGAISADGRFIAFDSDANNLSSADDNSVRNIFMRDFLGDTVPPETTIDSGPGAGETITDPTPTFGFSSSESPPSFECSVDGGAFAACSSPQTTGPLGDGSHTFSVRAVDSEPNVDPTPASRQFTVDTKAPVVEITKKPKKKLKTEKAKAKASVSFRSEAGAEFECQVDNGAFKDCSSPFVAKAKTKPGKGKKHSISIVATDAVGNESGPAKVSFRAIRKG